MRSWQITTRWLLGSQFAARALGLVNNVLLARLLAPASYGDFTQAMALAGSLIPLADGGVSAIVTRHTARRPRAYIVLEASIGLRIVQSLLLWGATTGAAWWILDYTRIRTALALAGGYWAVACALQLLAGVARARLQAHLETRAVLLERVATVLLAGVGAWQWGLVGALGGVLAGGSVALAFYLRALPLPRGRFSGRMWKRLLALGAPLAVADLCHGVIMRLDLLAIGMRYGSHNAGWYGGASALLWASNLVAGSMALALVPVAAAREEETQHLSVRVLRRMLLTALPLAAALSMGAELWVRLLYGAAYAPTADVLRMLAWCLVPASVVAWGNAVLLVRRQTVKVGIVAVGGLTCLAYCLYWWLPLGLIGASYAQLATQCGMAIGLWWFTKRTKAVAP
ncbi:MAG: oligosaccharide flippase family protein [Armatimonadota bacterium]|nr:oligosaccharide flippase family protein [Armatimonadota bacterium]